MLEEANPGTHSSYETDVNGRFKYLFIAFGQSIRGFTNVMRRVIVIDGTFLKSKFKGVLLVATALDGNSNLYPIAFGIVDSENHQSWEWFMRQLKVVVADGNGLAFISDRQGSIAKAVENVGKGLAGFVSKASKAYRVADFKRIFGHVCNISPAIGTYLMEADVKKWARCQFIGFRRKKKISKHKHPLTIDVEEKIERRIEKGKTFVVYPITDSQMLVKGDIIDCFVDLDNRTCSCGKFNLLKIPCRHAIKAGYSVGREAHTLTDFMYTTGA
ncbi:uncharacterized protein LOC130503293 [Raphanus sativus]|uniref:Uncharacterized protein LOC130503293 n=1 Tax=Raphanus sativus TaxID=3726 RepID=A0A9W3CQZ5_RAPSA|nr:uncharacterized protein LOC130503293 [Raphanus sativus]